MKKAINYSVTLVFVGMTVLISGCATDHKVADEKVPFNQQSTMMIDTPYGKRLVRNPMYGVDNQDVAVALTNGGSVVTTAGQSKGMVIKGSRVE